MAEPNKNGRFRDPTWGEVSYPAGPIWPHNASNEWDRDHHPDVGGLPPLPFTLAIRSNAVVEQHAVFGAYCDGRLFRVLYRFYEDDTPGGRRFPADSLATLGPLDTYVVYASGPYENLRVQDWRRFDQLTGGAPFKIKGRLWLKVKIEDLRRLIEGRIFDVAFPLAKPLPAGVMRPRPGEYIYAAPNYPPRPATPRARFFRFRAGPPG